MNENSNSNCNSTSTNDTNNTAPPVLPLAFEHLTKPLTEKEKELKEELSGLKKAFGKKHEHYMEREREGHSVSNVNVMEYINSHREVLPLIANQRKKE